MISQLISYDNGIIKGNGEIVGIATNDNAVIGKGYIVRDLSGNIPSNDYPYEYFILHEIHMKKEDKLFYDKFELVSRSNNDNYNRHYMHKSTGLFRWCGSLSDVQKFLKDCEGT